MAGQVEGRWDGAGDAASKRGRLMCIPVYYVLPCGLWQGGWMAGWLGGWVAAGSSSLPLCPLSAATAAAAGSSTPVQDSAAQPPVIVVLPGHNTPA